MAKKKKDGRGRPPTETDLLAQKLEPYLKMGFSMRKACESARVVRNTVKKYMEQDDVFCSKITSFRNYKSILYGNIMMAKLMELSKEVEKAKKLGLSLKAVFTKTDWRILEFMAKNDKALREEWGDWEGGADDESKRGYAFSPPKTEEEAKLQAEVLNRHYEFIKQKQATKRARDGE